MTYRISYHPRARSDLKRIAVHLAQYTDARNAGVQLDRIQQVIRKLSDLPHKGTLRDEVLDGLRALPAGENAVVTFLVHEEARAVFILTVTYGGADWAAMVRNRT